MRVTVSKILNRTDLAQSGSHGGLVVTKSNQKLLKDFFEAPGIEQVFIDKYDQEEFLIHYQDYTSNGKTPSDRITPIGRYASKHDLQPGDILVLDRIDSAVGKEYFIKYMKSIHSVFFAGKSKTSVDVLNFDHLIKMLSSRVSDGTVTKVSENEYVMQVEFQGVCGQLKIQKNVNDYELYFEGNSISESRKYFELDTLSYPFVLRKTETWRVAIDAEKADEEANKEADAELITELLEFEIPEGDLVYNPVPEAKTPPRVVKGHKVPVRSKVKSSKALTRAGYQCEVGEHETFLRKKSRLPYTEPHHIIPMQYDEQFEYSLDVEANIVSLCSTCHNNIHYGIDSERIIRLLWEKRKDELERAGLLYMKNGTKLNVDILLSFYGIK